MLVHQKMIDDKLRLEFKYKVQADRKEVKNYGLALARCLRFPSSLIDRAEMLIEKIEDESLLKYMEQVVTKDESVFEKTTATAATTANSKSETGSSMSELERDVIDLYSYILLLMSTEEGKEYTHISIDVINQKVMHLLDTMSPGLRELLNSRSLEEIIGILNSSSSFENSFSKFQ
jgi:DNA mismatch repair ATPase MutS